MQVRRLRTTEWALWKAIRLRALAADPAAFGSTLARESAYTDQDWQERAALLAKGIDRVMFLAEAGNAVVGCGGAFLESDGTPGVVSMWVEPSFRRQRAARRLLSAIEEWARGRAKDRLTLVVLAGNREAEALYLATGFQFTGDTIEVKREGEAVMGRVMGLRLATVGDPAGPAEFHGSTRQTREIR